MYFNKLEGFDTDNLKVSVYQTDTDKFDGYNDESGIALFSGLSLEQIEKQYAAWRTALNLAYKLEQLNREDK